MFHTGVQLISPFMHLQSQKMAYLAQVGRQVPRLDRAVEQWPRASGDNSRAPPTTRRAVAAAASPSPFRPSTETRCPAGNS